MRTVLLILLLPLACLAQHPLVTGAGIDWRLLSSGTAQDIIQKQPGVAYYWNFLDLTNGNKVTNWIDRIKGVSLAQNTSANQPTNSAKGVRFNSDRSVWLAITNGPLILSTNGGSGGTGNSNVLVYCVINWDADQTSFNENILVDTNNTSQGAMFLNTGNPTQLASDHPQLSTSLWGFNSGGGVPTQLQFDNSSMMWETNTTHCGATNGVDIGINIPFTFTNFTRMGNKASGGTPYSGYLACLALFTNTYNTPTLISNLHWFRTNAQPNGLGL